MVLEKVVVVVGDSRSKVKEVASKFRASLADVEVVEGIGRKDPTVLELLRKRVPILSVVIVLGRDEYEEEVIWQCWTHRWSGVAITWSRY